MVFEHEHEHGSQWAAIQPIAGKIGCGPETLRKWVRRAEIDQEDRPGETTDERKRDKDMGREIHEPRRANEILPLGDGFFRPGKEQPVQGRGRGLK